LPAESISHYKILRTIAAGGMGEVFEAEDLQLGRHVALKFLRLIVLHTWRGPLTALLFISTRLWARMPLMSG
jgi:serine/threonine protein kinase